MIHTNALTKLAPALLAAQKTMGNASKDAKNPFFKSKFADLNSVREVAHTALNANGITILQPMENKDGKNFVVTTLLHESGEYISSYTEVVCAKQNDPQALGSAISYARRYGLQAFMSIGAEDNDGESAMNRNAPLTQTTVSSTSGLASGTLHGVINGAGELATQTNVGSFKVKQNKAGGAKVDWDNL